MKKGFLCIIFFTFTALLFSQIVINGITVPNGGQITLYKNISKQDVSIQGGGSYYLLDNIPVVISDTTQYKMLYSNDGFSTLFNDNISFYIQYGGETHSLNLLNANSQTEIQNGVVNGTLSSNLSLQVSGANPINGTQLGNSKVCNILFQYGENLQESATLQLIVTYDPSNINKPKGDGQELQNPKVTTDNLIFNVGKNIVGEKPLNSSITKITEFYSATRNLIVRYYPSTVQDCGLPYGFTLVVNNDNSIIGDFSSAGTYYATLTPQNDRYTPFPFELTIAPIDPEGVFTQIGEFSLTGKFVLMYY